MSRWIKGTFISGLTLVLAGTVDNEWFDAPQPPPLAAQAQVAQRPPEKPRVRIDIPAYVRGRVTHVAAGGKLQEAIDKAQPGETITLEPGATYEGPFQLRRKDGTDWITIMTAAAQLPAAGIRVAPSHAALMPKLVADGDAVIVAEPGSHHYRFIGLEVTPAEGTYVNTLIQLGDAEKALDQLPHHFI